MFEKISKTQTANYVAFAMFVIQALDLNIAESEVQTLITGFIGIVAVIIAFFERYKRGDLKLSGARK